MFFFLPGLSKVDLVVLVFAGFSGYVLENNVISSYQVASQVECGSKCLRDTRCLSFNYKITNSNMDECEINKANKSTCPDCYRAQRNTIYYDDEVSLYQESLWMLISKCSCRLRVRTSLPQRQRRTAKVETSPAFLYFATAFLDYSKSFGLQDVY